MIGEDAALTFDNPNTPMNEAAMEALKQMRESYKQTFVMSRHGEKVLEDLINYTQYLGSAYTGNAKTYFNEGAQAVGRYILMQLGIVDAKSLVDMLSTNIKAREKGDLIHE